MSTDARKKRGLKASPSKTEAAAKPMNIWKFDDELASKMIPEERLIEFTQATKDLRSLMHQYKSDIKGTDAVEQQKMRDDFIEKMLLMKRLNRLGHFQNKQSKEKVVEKRQEVEEKYLKLQNYLYEFLHLQKEVKNCLEFQSAHEQIELISLDDFNKRAPTEMASADLSPHQLRLNRLTWEQQEREQLEVKLKEEIGRKEELEKRVAGREDQLDDLQPQIQLLLQASRPVQEALQIDYADAYEQKKRARHLPGPLFYLYSQAKAYKHLEPSRFQLEICGEGGDSESASLAESGESEGEEAKQQEEVEKEVESESGKKRKKSLAKQAAKREVSARHNLCLSFTFLAKAGGKLVVNFFYIPALSLIVIEGTFDAVGAKLCHHADVLSGENMLDSLYPKDTGLDCPSGAVRLKLKSAGSSFKRVLGSQGKAYFWAQELCGLAEYERTQVHLQGESQVAGFLRRVEGIIAIRCQLNRELLDLEKGRLNGSSSACAEGRIGSFCGTTLPDIEHTLRTESKEASHLGPLFAADQPAWFYNVSLERTKSELPRLNLFLSLSYYHPYVPPAVLLESKENPKYRAENLKEVEKQLNLGFWEDDKRVEALAESSLFTFMTQAIGYHGVLCNDKAVVKKDHFRGKCRSLDLTS